MSNLNNHPSYWLADDAAASLNRYEADHGKINLTDAGRTVAEQQALIDRWYRGGAANRPPYLYKPYEPAASGPHVGGHALDTSDYSRFAQLSAQYGWIHNLPSSDPVHFIYDPNQDQHRGGTSSGNQVTKDRQNFLNATRGEQLVVDGIEGDKTKAAYARYQTFLRAFGYTGAIDGIWGTNTQIAHAAYYASLHTPAAPAASNPFGISDVRGLQKVAKKYGGNTAPDNAFGAESKKGFAQFLRANYGYSGNDELGPVMWAAIARWLRAKYSYVGNDIPGPQMRAALQRASDANNAAL